MKALKAIGLYAVAVVLLGALLAPWLFWFVQSLGNAWLADQPFKRIFNRSVMIVALAGLWPLLRALGVRSWSAVGYTCRPDWWRQTLTGFALGVGSVLLAFVVQHRDFAFETEHPVSLVAKLMLTAGIVAVIEETFFRGGLQGVLQRGMHWLPALALSSAIYSALHFLKPKGVRIAADAVTWHSGLDYLGQIVSRSLAAPDVAVAFVTLFIAGWILGWAFVKTQALYLPIGLHAGWVLANEFIRASTHENIVETPVAWVLLLATWGIVIWMGRRQSMA